MADRPATSVRRSGGKLQASQDRNLQTKVLAGLTKLDSVHTCPNGVSELQRIVRTMSKSQIPLFLNLLCKIIDKRPTATRKECASLFGYLACQRGLALKPYLDTIIRNLVRRLNDPSAEVHKRVSRVMADLINNVTIPATLSALHPPASPPESPTDPKKTNPQRSDFKKTDTKPFLPRKSQPFEEFISLVETSPNLNLSSDATTAVMARGESAIAVKNDDDVDNDVDDDVDDDIENENDGDVGGDVGESDRYLGERKRGEVGMSPVMSELNSPVTARAINSPVTARAINSPVTARAINSPVTARAINSPVTARAINSPVMARAIKSPSTQTLISTPGSSMVHVYLDYILPALSGNPNSSKGASWCLGSILNASQKFHNLITPNVVERIWKSLNQQLKIASSRSARNNPYIMSACSNLILSKIPSQYLMKILPRCLEYFVAILRSAHWPCAKCAVEGLYACSLAVVAGGVVISEGSQKAIIDGLAKAKYHKTHHVRDSAKEAIRVWEQMAEVKQPPITFQAINMEFHDFSEIPLSKSVISSTRFKTWADLIFEKGKGGIVGRESGAEMVDTFISDLTMSFDVTINPGSSVVDSKALNRFQNTAESKVGRGLISTSAGLEGDGQIKTKRLMSLLKKVANSQNVILTRLQHLQEEYDAGFKAMSQRLITLDRKISSLHSQSPPPPPKNPNPNPLPPNKSPRVGNNLNLNSKSRRVERGTGGGGGYGQLMGGRDTKLLSGERKDGGREGGIWDNALFFLRIKDYDSAFVSILAHRDDIQLVRLMGRIKRKPEQVLNQMHPTTNDLIFAAVAAIIRKKCFVLNTFPWLYGAIKVEPPLPSKVDVVKEICDGLGDLIRDRSSPSLGNQAASMLAVFSKHHVGWAAMVNQPSLAPTRHEAMHVN
ncbi:hypothetical protein AAMO2058_000370200 [Amorphochlora amoebiformis]